MRSRSGSKRRPMSEINVVPYIDVMLVLLVIFMATAPLLMQGIEVALPNVDNDMNLIATTPQSRIGELTPRGWKAFGDEIDRQQRAKQAIADTVQKLVFGEAASQ